MTFREDFRVMRQDGQWWQQEAGAIPKHDAERKLAAYRRLYPQDVFRLQRREATVWEFVEEDQ